MTREVDGHSDSCMQGATTFGASYVIVLFAIEKRKVNLCAFRRSATEIQCRLPCATEKIKKEVARSALRRLSRSKRNEVHTENHLVVSGLA